MTNPSREDPGEAPARGEGTEDDMEEGPAGARAKLALVLFPFTILLFLLILDWWLRGRS